MSHKKKLKEVKRLLSPCKVIKSHGLLVIYNKLDPSEMKIIKG